MNFLGRWLVTWVRNTEENSEIMCLFISMIFPKAATPRLPFKLLNLHHNKPFNMAAPQRNFASYGHSDPENIKEHMESQTSIDRKIQEVASLIAKSRHLVAFTGAGVSTSAGIPDFRGPEGVWTLRDQGRARTSPTTSSTKAIPTPTHVALVELQNRGILKYVISQNTDGLHRKSGILPDKISELHGNSNREVCSNCGKEYIRDFRAVASYSKSVHDHKTGRNCSKCGGDLEDTIINFSEPLPRVPLQLAYQHAMQADVMLVLGSSLTVSPANEMPRITYKSGGKVVICNLQNTPLDQIASVRVFAKTDQLMEGAMRNLGYSIPPFLLNRHLVVEVDQDEKSKKIQLYGVDVDGTPVSFVHHVELKARDQTFQVQGYNERFMFRMDPRAEDVTVRLHFFGHYNEVALDLRLDLQQDKKRLLLRYNPREGKWSTESV